MEAWKNRLPRPPLSALGLDDVRREVGWHCALGGWGRAAEGVTDNLGCLAVEAFGRVVRSPG